MRSAPRSLTEESHRSRASRLHTRRPGPGWRSRLGDGLEHPGWRFGILALLGFLLVALQTARGTNQIFDFWEHAANVHQLMLHPFHPGNALLAIRTPSAFFSPYALLVALGAKLTGAGAVHALAAAGLVNYWLLMAGIWWFTRVFSTQRQAPFYTLLFVWLLWGVSPWKYSGFFDLRALSAVIAYPSTFATALGMLTAALWQRTLARPGPDRWPLAALTALGLAVVVLTHPVAGVATAAAILAVSLTTRGPGERWLMLILVAVAAGLLCLAWPYYSLLRLLGDQSVYDPSNSVMYSAWVVKIFPLLAALVLVFHRTGTLQRARLGIYCAPLLALFVYGGVSGHYGEGRVISYLALGAQIGLADLVASFERPVRASLHGRRLAVLAVGLAVLGLAELYNMRGGFRGSLPGTGTAPSVYADYRVAVAGLPPGATIAAPLNDGAEAAIPAYAGRLIATHRPLAFVKDQGQRQETVYTFFFVGANNDFRRGVIARYGVRYILAPLEEPPLVAQLRQLGTVVRDRGGFETLAVRP